MRESKISYHAMSQYMARTGRQPELGLYRTLIGLIRLAKPVDLGEIRAVGIDISRMFKGDTYYLWFDEKINDFLLAVVARDGTVKTVLRKDMYSIPRNGLGNKMRGERPKGTCYTHGYESAKKKRGYRR